ncbi:threonine/serine exporter family protein [Fusobacterium sp. MFO224]|uniref:threonine/serine exporter family protein n=1 Tax=Fusobacterium sp. MFO224 TaxID=3378070 RepID=UPI0038550097
MENVTILQHFIILGVTSLCFGVFLSIPKLDIVIGGVIGGFSWALYIFLMRISGEVILPYFISTLSIGILGNISSKITKRPTFLYMLPGIIPLVPGYSLYYTMFYIVTENYPLALHKGIETLFIAFSISSGLIVSESLKKIVNNILKNLKR